MSAGDDAEQPGQMVKRTTLFWWVAIGSVFTGIATMSLVATVRKLGLTGFAGLVHNTYVLGRDIVFNLMESALPIPHLEADARAILAASAIYVGICARTYYLVRPTLLDGQRSALREVQSALLFILIAAVVMGVLSLYFLDALGYDTRQIGKDYSLVVLAGLVGGFLMLFIPEHVRSKVMRTLALNGAACVAIAIILLALGGAF